MNRRALILAAAALPVAALPASATEQLRRLVKDDLRRFGFVDVDVNDLTPSQLGAIHAVANEKRRGGQRGMIRSILGGQNSLRGLFR